MNRCRVSESGGEGGGLIYRSQKVRWLSWCARRDRVVSAQECADKIKVEEEVRR